MSLPSHITVVEVGPRDGLQSQAMQVSIEDRITFIDLLSRSGLPVIETGAMVSPKWVPQMAGSDDVFSGIQKHDNVRYPLLVPNQKGLDRALAVGAREVAVFTAASETFNRKNINASIAESIDRFRPVVTRAKAESIRVRGYVSTCFGCPYEGAVHPQAVVDVVHRLEDLGVDEFSIGDTIGLANPASVETVFTLLLHTWSTDRLALHAHDTRGTALANCLRAMELGIYTFDTSAGGVGGCPYAPGATGNMATEDLVFMAEAMDVDTGVDLTVLVQASAFLESVLGVMPGKAYQAIRRSAAQG